MKPVGVLVEALDWSPGTGLPILPIDSPPRFSDCPARFGRSRGGACGADRAGSLN